MVYLENPLLKLYLNVFGWVALGFLIGRQLPRSYSTYLAKFLFFFGTPLSIVAFIRSANLSGAIWKAPLIAWAAILAGGGLAGILIIFGVGEERFQTLNPAPNSPEHTSALFYDLLGTTMGINILGVAIASHCGKSDRPQSWLSPVRAIFLNPALWAFGVGFVSRSLPLSPQIAELLTTGAWTVITLALITIGMQLSKLNSLHNFKPVLASLAIKMLLVPLVIGTGLTFLGIAGAPRLVLVLQMAMPPAFGTTLLAEAFNLDRELAVTAIGIGCVSLLFTIPLWMRVFDF